MVNLAFDRLSIMVPVFVCLLSSLASILNIPRYKNTLLIGANSLWRTVLLLVCMVIRMNLNIGRRDPRKPEHHDSTLGCTRCLFQGMSFHRIMTILFSCQWRLHRIGAGMHNMHFSAGFAARFWLSPP